MAHSGRARRGDTPLGDDVLVRATGAGYGLVVVQPADAADVLTALRGYRAARPAVDRAWCAGLREVLSDAARGVGGEESTASGAPIVVRDLGGRIGEGGGDQGVAGGWLGEAVVQALFRLVVAGAAVDDPWRAALDALVVTPGGAAVAAAVGRLGVVERRALAASVAAQGRWLAGCWPELDPRWVPTVGETVLAPLAGGAVLLSAAPDLCLGVPARTVASRCFVSVAAGRTDAVWERLWVAAVAEALRCGAPPFQLAVVDASQRTLATAIVDRAGLWEAVAQIGARIRQPGAAGSGVRAPDPSRRRSEGAGPRRSAGVRPRRQQPEPAARGGRRAEEVGGWEQTGNLAWRTAS